MRYTCSSFLVLVVKICIIALSCKMLSENPVGYMMIIFYVIIFALYMMLFFEDEIGNEIVCAICYGLLMMINPLRIMVATYLDYVCLRTENFDKRVLMNLMPFVLMLIGFIIFAVLYLVGADSKTLDVIAMIFCALLSLAEFVMLFCFSEDDHGHIVDGRRTQTMTKIGELIRDAKIYYYEPTWFDVSLQNNYLAQSEVFIKWQGLIIYHELNEKVLHEDILKVVPTFVASAFIACVVLCTILYFYLWKDWDEDQDEYYFAYRLIKVKIFVSVIAMLSMSPCLFVKNLQLFFICSGLAFGLNSAFPTTLILFLYSKPTDFIDYTAFAECSYSIVYFFWEIFFNYIPPKFALPVWFYLQILYAAYLLQKLAFVFWEEEMEKHWKTFNLIFIMFYVFHLATKLLFEFL